nr:CapA family protein [Saccharofermentans sp.]
MTEKPSRKTNSIILTFTGDTSSSGIFDQIVRSNTCLEDPIVSSDIIDFFRLGDEVIVNLEGPITDKPCSKTKGSCVSSSPAFARVLRALGVTVLNLANNHMTDCGIEGLADTLSIARDNGMYTVGAGADLDEASRPLVLERKGISVALIATTHFEGITATNNSPGVFCAEKDFSLARSIIADIKNRYDWVVMNYHGGEEYVHIPMPRRRRLMRRFLDLGVDVIICHHPHVVQGYEQFG